MVLSSKNVLTVTVGAATAVLIVGLWRKARASTGTTLWVVGDSQACLASQLIHTMNDGKSFLTGTTVVDERRLKVVCRFGSRTAEWNQKIKTLPIVSGDTVLLFLGSNEMDARPDPLAIVQSVRGRNANLVWVGPPTIRGRSGLAPDFLKATLASLGVPYVDSRDLHLAQRDGVHPTDLETLRWIRSVLVHLPS